MRKCKCPTADCKNVIPDHTYFWFDRMYKRVESANWMEQQIDRTNSVVFIQGSKIPIAWLREKRSDAIQDGIVYYSKKIATLDTEIAALRELIQEEKEAE